MIPQMTDPLGRHWQQPADIREAPMDETHVLLTPRQIAELYDYSSSYPSGTYDGKCWKREGEDCWYLCWYQPHATPGKIGIGFRIILEVDDRATKAAASHDTKPDPLTHCAAGRDGECLHVQCPQLRDGEPAKSGRHCPIDS